MQTSVNLVHVSPRHKYHHQGLFSVATVAPSKRPFAQQVCRNSHTLTHALKHKYVRNTNIKTLDSVFEKQAMFNRNPFSKVQSTHVNFRGVFWMIRRLVENIQPQITVCLVLE